MKTVILLACLTLLNCTSNDNQILETPEAKVSYSDFENLVKEVKTHRAERLIDFNLFSEKSLEDNVIILDTRSKEMYDKKHIKGAIHLNFSDFTQDNLSEIIPDKTTTILIYCNNNFVGDPIHFATKSIIELPSIEGTEKEEITLALNIPTYINLYGYGYKNVYELSELISAFDTRIAYEGSTVQQYTSNN